MSNALTVQAADDYLELTLASKNHGIIGRGLLLARLERLVQLGQPSCGSVAYANSLLVRAGREAWPIGRNLEVGIGPSNGAPISFSARGAQYAPPALQDEGWIIATDQFDTFPSLPHGINETSGRATLDVFLGWKYDAADQQGRLDISTHVSLWNDSRFRSVSAEALQLYLDLDHQRDWRLLR